MVYKARLAYAICANKEKGTVLGLRDEGTSEVIGVLAAQRVVRPAGGGSFKQKDAKAVRPSEVGKPPHEQTAAYGEGPLKRDEAILKGTNALSFPGAQYMIYAIAIHPAHQERGYASSLVHAATALGDRDDLPVTVECAGERMEKMYTSLGFEKHAQTRVEDPTKETAHLDMVSMVRMPRSFHKKAA